MLEKKLYIKQNVDIINLNEIWRSLWTTILVHLLKDKNMNNMCEFASLEVLVLSIKPQPPIQEFSMKLW